MGMMDMAPMPLVSAQDMSAPMPQVSMPDMSAQMPNGMMGGQPQPASPTLSHGKFNGTVTVEGQPVEVKTGVAQVEGKPYMVSDDGKMVVDSEGKLVGHIENGEFMVADEAYMKQMQQAGYVE